MLSCVKVIYVFSLPFFVQHTFHSLWRRCLHQYIAMKMPADFSFSPSSRNASMSSS